MSREDSSMYSLIWNYFNNFSEGHFVATVAMIVTTIIVCITLYNVLPSDPSMRRAEAYRECMRAAFAKSEDCTKVVEASNAESNSSRP